MLKAWAKKKKVSIYLAAIKSLKEIISHLFMKDCCLKSMQPGSGERPYSEPIVKAWGPEFHPQHLWKKSKKWGHELWNPSTVDTKTRGSLGLADWNTVGHQPALESSAQTQQIPLPYLCPWPKQVNGLAWVPHKWKMNNPSLERMLKQTFV